MDEGRAFQTSSAATLKGSPYMHWLSEASVRRTSLQASSAVTLKGSPYMHRRSEAGAVGRPFQGRLIGVPAARRPPCVIRNG